MNTLIFDIGKTNKKYFIFDNKLNVIKREETVFPEIKDEDGFLCDDIEKISDWIRDIFNEVKDKYSITKVNFSTYGASFVFLDEDNDVIPPVYNYLKPLEDKIKEKFLKLTGAETVFSLETSSPFLGMLNSGLQLYRLKYKNPEKFKRIKTALHFPQYCSFLLTGNKYSEYTSIGCHTGLWDFSKKDYHKWIYDENLDKILAPIVRSDNTFASEGVEFGIGVHDSSASLIPYLEISNKKFVLLSTGTWSISLNPYNEEKLTEIDLNNDCLMFMTPTGKSVKAARLFLGKELENQVNILATHFGKSKDYFKTISFDKQSYNNLNNKDKVFYFNEIGDDDKRNTRLDKFSSFEEAYHQLMKEIVDRQIISLNLAIGNTKGIENIYIDGGFANNELFCKILSIKLLEYKIYKTYLASGSALGAAIIINQDELNQNLLIKKTKIEIIEN